jgi:hypothetical protein
LHRPVSEALSHPGPVATAWLTPRHRRLVTSAHVGPSLTDDDLCTTKLAGRHVVVVYSLCSARVRRGGAFPQGSGEAEPSHGGRARRRPLHGGRPEGAFPQGSDKEEAAHRWAVLTCLGPS